MKAALVALLVMLRDFLTSKKTLTAALTAVASAFIKDPAIRDRVVAVGLLLLGSIAAVDHAKAGAGAKTATLAAAGSIVDVAAAEQGHQ